MKKIISIFLALAMILSLNTTAFAKDYKLTINDADGHTYDIYQIYTGDASPDGEDIVLSNVKYGQNPYPKGKKEGNLVPEDYLNELADEDNDPVSILNEAVKGTTPFRNDVVPGANGTIELSLPAGYYMIVDVSDSLSGETKSPVILQVLGDAEVTSKHALITSEKKVDDKNDSNADEDGIKWQDSADYDIGDDVPFQLSVTLPSTLSNYDEYELTFHDKQQAGFGNPVNFNVYILKKDGSRVELTNVDDYSVQDCEDNNCVFGNECSFIVCVYDVKAHYNGSAISEGDKLIVEYTAELQDDANIGSTGNENGMYVCHPDGKTPEDYVTVFTYQLTIDKIDGKSKEALKGAGFTLYKLDAKTGTYVAIGGEITGNDLTTFSWTGIDDGTYKLVESTTPEGYNTIEDIVFTVTAGHKTEWTKGNGSAFESLNSDKAFVDADDQGALDGKLAGKVENYAGIVLPETGGKGTIMLIGISSALVAIAAIFMITRKKMSIYED